MQLPWQTIQSNAINFAPKWKDVTSEKSHGQAFTIDLLRAFGIENPALDGTLEYPVPKTLSTKGYIDYLRKGKGGIAIEMKSRGEDLNKAFEQLRGYMARLPEQEVPNVWLVCDFENMRVRDWAANTTTDFKTKDLHKHIRRFANLAGHTIEKARAVSMDVNRKAAEKMARLHNLLKECGYDGKKLEVYLVRLLFCLFADHAGIFPQDSFFNYIGNSKGDDVAMRIQKLFDVLDMPKEERARRTNLPQELLQFEYVNGSLFSEKFESPELDARMILLLRECASKFDWSKISPAIFGAMFQGVMDEKQRREIGAHYTSEENILKLIRPLFLDDLWAEFERIKTNPKALEAFHDKIASLKFLDPACGCGNFLIVTYRELRLLELAVIEMKTPNLNQTQMLDVLLKVNVSQFYGIEYEPFPCQVAQTAMWLMDHLMNKILYTEFGLVYARLPLKQSATIVCGNALRMNWESVVPKESLSYVLGNPPFVGKKEQTQIQKAEIIDVFENQKGVGILDYVSGWYKKATQMICGTSIRVAFVSTNSISQGEQPAILWKSLLDKVKIDFAYRTFKWSNEAKGKAAVHCVIIGFSQNPVRSERTIFDENDKTIATNINPYLVDAPNVLIGNRTKPLCNVPEMMYGSMPIDDGALILSHNEKEDLLKVEPQSQKFLRKYVGGEEFINNTVRYCLWLKGFAPHEIMNSKIVAERIVLCQKFRKQSDRPQTKALADTPYLFGEIRQPDTNMLIVPKVSSENRKYLPIGFLSPEIIVNGSALIIPSATLYHFGILSSIVHNAWTRAVCGRMKSDYQYSASIVYNNFIWTDASDQQKIEIEKLAQAVLDAGAMYTSSSLAALYSLVMPPELLKAHQALDRAVMKLYGFTPTMTEPEIVAALMERYQGITKE